jgi:aconitase B
MRFKGVLRLAAAPANIWLYYYYTSWVGVGKSRQHPISSALWSAKDQALVQPAPVTPVIKVIGIILGRR